MTKNPIYFGSAARVVELVDTRELKSTEHSSQRVIRQRLQIFVNNGAQIVHMDNFVLAEWRNW